MNLTETKMVNMVLSESETESTRHKYNKSSKLYNLFELPMELLFFRRWRRKLFSQLKDGKVLEVGIGTGKNLPYYPIIKQSVGIDLSEGMLTMQSTLLLEKM